MQRIPTSSGVEIRLLSYCRDQGVKLYRKLRAFYRYGTAPAATIHPSKTHPQAFHAANLSAADDHSLWRDQEMHLYPFSQSLLYLFIVFCVGVLIKS